MSRPAPVRASVCLAHPRLGRLLLAGILLFATIPSAWAKPNAAVRVAATNATLVAAIDKDPRDSRWRYIVIHHTAGAHDSLKAINHWHGKRFDDPLGIQYHFLIGNGGSAPDGAIQIGRWQYRAQSIHVVHPDRAPTAITVSLQGVLHLKAPSPAQMVATESLIRRLMTVYGIPADRVTTNTRVDGTFTLCPGKFFPFDRLAYRLRTKTSVALADWQNPLAPVPLEGPVVDLEAMRAGLRWDRPCEEPIPIGALQTLQVLDDRRTGVQARLLGLDGGRGCTPIERKLLAVRGAKGWYALELNGYRSSKLRMVHDPAGARVQVSDEQGPVLTCAVRPDEAPTCGPVRPAPRCRAPPPHCATH
jgi:hypothetical protein